MTAAPTDIEDLPRVQADHDEPYAQEAHQVHHAQKVQ